MIGSPKRSSHASYRVTANHCVLSVLLLLVGASANAADITRTRIVVCDEPPNRLLGAAIASAIIDSTLGRIGSALRAAGEAETKSIVVHRNLELAPGTGLTCVALARGRWGDQASAWRRPGDAAAIGASGLNFGTASNPEYLQSDPDYVVLLRIDDSTDGSAQKLIPEFLQYNRHVTDTKKGRRGLSMEVAFHGPGEGSNHKNAVGSSLVLGDFEPGHRYDLATGVTQKRDRRSGAWQNIAGLRPSLQEESAWFPSFVTSVDAAAAVPKIVTVTLAETRAARPMLLFLADVFDASKDDIKTGLETRLISSQREQADLAIAQQKDEQRLELLSAQADADIAWEEYRELGCGQSASRYLDASKEVFVERSTANLIATRLGLEKPFPTVASPSTGHHPELDCN